MGEVRERKTVNALIPEAAPGFAAKFILGSSGAKGVGLTIDIMKRLMGGLWVGGTTYLEEEAFVFRPNLLNRAIHAGDYIVKIPFGDIVGVEVRFGIVTKIIDIVTKSGKLSIRCYGADKYAERLRGEIEGAKLI